jgi:hypothetical protein
MDEGTIVVSGSDQRSVRMPSSLLVLGVVASPHTLASAALIITATGAETAPFLLIPGTQALPAKRKVVIIDDGGLNPGVEGLRVGEVVVVGGSGGRGRSLLF